MPHGCIIRTTDGAIALPGTRAENRARTCRLHAPGHPHINPARSSSEELISGIWFTVPFCHWIVRQEHDWKTVKESPSNNFSSLFLSNRNFVTEEMASQTAEAGPKKKLVLNAFVEMCKWEGVTLLFVILALTQSSRHQAAGTNHPVYGATRKTGPGSLTKLSTGLN